MYDVFIRNFKQNSGAITTSWTKMFGVPANDANGFPVDNPSVRGAEDAADSFDFSMEMNSPYYDALLQLKTLIQVQYDGDVIFYGRVLTIDGSTVYQTKNVHCEGCYAFMNDTQYEGKEEKKRDKIGWSEYYNRIINNHNTMLQSTPEKGLTRGTVTIDGTTPFVPTTEVKQFEPSSWTQTTSLISSLVSEYGGHFKTRLTNGIVYLDWYKYYARDLGNDRPVVSVGDNIIDISFSSNNVDKIFTWVIPTGSSAKGTPVTVDGYTYTDKNGVKKTHHGKAVPVSIVRELYTDAQLNDEFHSAAEYSSAEDNYGFIFKTQSFAGAKTQAELWNFTKEWIKNCYFELASSFTVRAYDMHILDPNKSKILVGDCVTVRYYIIENGVKVQKSRKLVCKAVTYDLFNPDNNSYTFGIPSEILNRTYSEGRKSGSEQVAGGGGGSGGGSEDGPIDANFATIAELILGAAGESSAYGGRAAYDSFLANGPITGTVKYYDPDELPSGETIAQHKDLIRTANIVGKITSSSPTKWVAVDSGKGIFAFVAAGGHDGAIPSTFWYKRVSGKQTVNFTTELPFLSEEGKQVVEMAKNFGIYFKDADEVQDASNQLWIGIGDAAKGIISTVKDSLGSTKNPFKIITDTVGNFVSGFFGLDGPKSKLTVSTDGSNNGSKSIEVNAEDNSFNLGEWIQGLFTPKVNLDGQNGKGSFGIDENGRYRVTANDTITYVDENGETKTLSGFVKASDFSVREIPSFKTKFVAVDQLVADKATIGELAAAEAEIRNLKTTKLTTDQLSSKISELNVVKANSLSVSNGVTANWLMAPNIYVGVLGNGKLITNMFLDGIRLDGPDQTGKYTIYQSINGEETVVGTFSKAGGSILHWNWSTGTYTVLDENDTVVLSTTLQAVLPVPDSSVQKTGKVVYRPYQVMYGADEEHIYSTGKTSTISMDASAVFNDGWARALQDCEFPDLGTDATINVKLPNADTVEGTPRLREYTLSVDDNYAYLKRTDSGMSATAARVENPAYQRGKDAIKLALTWNDQNDTGTVSKTTSGNKNSISFVVTASADIEYNSSTHKYTAKSQGKIDGTARGEEGSKTSGTEAYDAGVSNGKGAVGLSIDTRYAKITKNTSSNTVTEVQIALNLGSVGSDGKRTVKVAANGTDLLTNVLSDYANGKAAGNDAAGVAGSWDGNVYTVERKANTAGKKLTCTVTAGVTLTYDSSTHKYKAIGRAYGNAEEKKTAEKTSGTEAYTAGVSDGNDAAGVAGSWDGNVYTVERKANTAGKKLTCTVTAGAAISYDTSTHKYTATGTAYGNAAAKKTATKESGTEAYDAGYKSGFDAGHGIWLVGGKADSGGSAVIDSGFYHIVYNKTSGQTSIAQSWEAPGCWLDIVTYDDSQEVLGYDMTLALVKTWSTGRRDVVKKWNTPPNGYDEAARAMKYPSAISGQSTKSTIYITHPKVGGGTEQYSLTLKKDSGGAYIMHNSVLLARVR